MAKVTFSNLLDDYQLLSNIYSGDFDLGSHNTKAATFKDNDTGNKIVLAGTGFHYSGDDMTSGDVDKVTFTNPAGKPLVSVTNASFDAGVILDIVETKGLEAALGKILGGKDTFIGSAHGDYMFGYGGADKMNGGAGNDALSGGLGNDRLTGDSGSDVFLFSIKGDHDVVTDFDADGSGKKQDYINLMSNTDYTIRKSGHDTIIDLGHGDMLTLLDVNRSHITKADFDLM